MFLKKWRKDGYDTLIQQIMITPQLQKTWT